MWSSGSPLSSTQMAEPGLRPEELIFGIFMQGLTPNPPDAVHLFPAKNHGVRLRGAYSHPGRFILSSIMLQCKLEAMASRSQQNRIIREKQRSDNLHTKAHFFLYQSLPSILEQNTVSHLTTISVKGWHPLSGGS
ncbi:hypothetical protein ATANTOWER_000466 [Ataeniobius toweri]|uniref:Uncharacterized protein n=1 Tax=Ataeniobius toweri TaxID=208326 RepID=A0ABU7BJZ1_9TELE|nr:hypothetical protein [Ataeniobius toweri]